MSEYDIYRHWHIETDRNERVNILLGWCAELTKQINLLKSLMFNMLTIWKADHNQLQMLCDKYEENQASSWGNKVQKLHVTAEYTDNKNLLALWVM